MVMFCLAAAREYTGVKFKGGRTLDQVFVPCRRSMVGLCINVRRKLLSVLSVRGAECLFGDTLKRAGADIRLLPHSMLPVSRRYWRRAMQVNDHQAPCLTLRLRRPRVFGRSYLSLMLQVRVLG